MDGLREGWRRLGVVFLATAVLVAFGPVAAAGGWWGGSDKPAVLRVTYSNKVDYEPLMVAVDKGFFRDEGLVVKPLIVTGGIESAEALATGAADIAAMGDAPAVISVSRYPVNRIVCAYGGGSQRHRLIASAAVRTPADLVGRRLGLQLGSSTHGCFLAWAKANGLDPAHVEVINLKPSEIPMAMAAGQLDAMAGSEPWATNTEKQCGKAVHELAHFGGHMGTPLLVLIASGRLLESRPEAVTKVIRAVGRAVAWMQAHPERAAAICAPLTGLSLQDQRRCTATLTWGLRWEPADAEALAMMAGFLMAHGKIATLPDLAAAVDTRPLRESQGR